MSSRCEICGRDKDITDYSQGIPLCEDCEKEADLDRIIQDRPSWGQEFNVFNESDVDPTFWFYKKGKRHYANQRGGYINDFTDDCKIPIDNFNYQIEVGLIKDIGSIKKDPE